MTADIELEKGIKSVFFFILRNDKKKKKQEEKDTSRVINNKRHYRGIVWDTLSEKNVRVREKTIK